MKKSIFIIAVLLCFGVYVVDIVQDAYNMNIEMIRAKSMLETAIDTAVNKTIASEEFFSENAQNSIAEKVGADGSTVSATNQTRYYSNGNWVTGNTYILAEYYSEAGALPETQGIYDTYAYDKDSAEHIFWYLFGGGNDTPFVDGDGTIYILGDDTRSPNANWVFNRSILDPSNPVPLPASFHRYPNTRFGEFYNNIGKEVTTKRVLRERLTDGVNYYWGTTTEETIPVLDLMGIDFSNINPDSITGLTSTKTTPVALTPKKQGKLIINKDTGATTDTTYYLTPYSLGVTYLDYSVLKVNLLTNIDTFVRLACCKNETEGIDYSKADGCVTSYVTKNKLALPTGDKTNPREMRIHTEGSNTEIKEIEGIINDGVIEYDTRTIQTKVDYFLVDFYDNANWKIVNRILGSTPDKDMSTLPERCHKLATGHDKGSVECNSDCAKLNKIVAKVDTKIKLHIPFQSAFEMWYMSRSDKVNNHYDLKEWNEDEGKIIEDTDGVWFYYSTYVAVI